MSLLAIPVATKYFPVPGPWLALWDVKKESLYSDYRIGIIIGALVVSFISFVILITSFATYKQGNPNLQVLHVVIFMLIFILTSIDFIYWAFGHFMLNLDSFPPGSYGLKRLAYITANNWSLLTNVHGIFLYLFVPVLMFRYGMRLVSKKGVVIVNFLIVINCILIIATSYHFEKDFWNWLAD